MVNGNLPDGWEWSTLGESCNIVLGQSPSSDTYNSEGIGLPFYQGKTEFGDLYPMPEKWCSSPKKLAEKDDILISVRAPVGPTNLCPEKSCIGRGLAALRPKNMPIKYFLHYLRYIEKEWDSKATGTTFKAITGDVLRNQEIPLAPLPEQERIVNRIEELLSDLDAGVAAMERVQFGLQRYKASVLKVACEGKLFESKELESSDELPVGWRWTTLESIALKRKHAISSGPFGSALGTKDYQESGVPVLRGQNIKNGKFNLDKLVYVSEQKAQELIRSTAIPGDLVVVAVGSSGQPAIVPDYLPRAILSQNCNKITLDNDVVLSSYILLVMQTDFAKSQLAERTTDTARPFLSLTNLKKTIIPLPPLDEQRRIVAEVERRLSVVGEVESAVEVGLVRAGRLRQSVLRSAFEGRL